MLVTEGAKGTAERGPFDPVIENWPALVDTVMNLHVP
jgi:hypothetical protein